MFNGRHGGSVRTTTVRLALLWGIAIFITGSSRAWARPCDQDVRILGAEARFRTHLLKGQPLRRDADIRVTVRSTATTAISGIELAVFLGARLNDVASTRAEALPTRRPRRFSSGGLAFRADVETMVPPGAKRVLVVKQRGLPIDGEAMGVTAKVVRCRRLMAATTAVVTLPPRHNPWTTWLYIGGLSLVGSLVIAGLRMRNYASK